MSKKIAGIIFIILGSIPFIMRLLPLLGLGPSRGPNGAGRLDLPSGGMPPGGPPGMLFGPYLSIIGIILIVIGIILLTHKHKLEKL